MRPEFYIFALGWLAFGLLGIGIDVFANKRLLLSQVLFSPFIILGGPITFIICVLVAVADNDRVVWRKK